MASDELSQAFARLWAAASASTPTAAHRPAAAVLPPPVHRPNPHRRRRPVVREQPLPRPLPMLMRDEEPVFYASQRDDPDSQLHRYAPLRHLARYPYDPAEPADLPAPVRRRLDFAIVANDTGLHRGAVAAALVRKTIGAGN